MSCCSSRIQLGFMYLDRNRSASLRLFQTSEASVRKPPPATGVAAKEGRLRYRLRLHVISASRTQCLCPDRDASSVTNRPLQRGVILHEKIHLAHIEPESVSGETDIEPRTMACRNLNKVLLTIETFHGEHGAQTVARIGQVSTQKAHNHFKRRRFSQGHREHSCGRVSQMTGPTTRYCRLSLECLQRPWWLATGPCVGQQGSLK
jgi:hypothetical protein